MFMTAFSLSARLGALDNDVLEVHASLTQLHLMDPSIKETDPAGRKRSHNEFSDHLIHTEPDAGIEDSTPDVKQSTPVGSLSLADAQSSTPTQQSGSPQTPSKAVFPKASPDGAQSGSPEASASKPVTKRKRLTPEEKQARERKIAEKKKEREAQAAARAAKRAREQDEKDVRAKERDEKRKRKEEEDKVKAEKRHKRENKKQRIQEEKDKEARSQTKLNRFLIAPKTPSKMADSSSNPTSPSKMDVVAPAPKSESVYEQLFKPFNVKDDMRLVKATAHMSEGTRETKSRRLDDLIGGGRELEAIPAPFNAEELLGLSCTIPRRGRLHHPVRHIMETASKEVERLGSRGGLASGNFFENVRRKLAKVPMKIIAFSQDIRPPYYGTLTMTPFGLGQRNISRQARRSTHQRLPLDYKYDSEAEWQDEEGEDVDVDDDEEEQDDDDMDGFLDDSEDGGLARQVFANTMEPQSPGILFENESGSAECMISEYKLEFMHERACGLDPWSRQYWEPEQKGKTAKGGDAAEGAKMGPSPAPVSALKAIGRVSEAETLKLVKKELMNDVKRVILDNKELSKASIIDIIFHRLRDDVSRAEVKNTVELIAEKGMGRGKEWDLKPQFKVA